ncbi:MAG: hypothetical protein D6797_09710 [Bdellovibrio sp.]|nr:MAG: hypothetical protein D6797_09710 [Bdellovibrio sp.]
MSLDELLNDKEASEVWKRQKRKLIQIIGGLSVITIGLLFGVLYFLSLKENKNISHKSSIKTEKEVQSLVKLMQLQKETQLLKDELAKMRTQKRKKQFRKTSAPYPSHSTSSSRPSIKVVNYDPGTGFITLTHKKENLYIPTGAVFQAKLITPIKTSVQKTFVIAEVTNEFRMDMKRRILKGSRLIGHSRLDVVLKGVIVEFDKLVLPNGKETKISALALSRNALPEIDGLYFSDKLQTYGTALAFGFLSGFSDAAMEREVTTLGSQPKPSLSNQILSGLSTSAFQVAEDILRDIQNRAIEYVVVPAGEPIFVALTRSYTINQDSGGLR